MGKTSRSLSLFDIRLEGTDHDVIVIKGLANDAPAVLLSGFVVLSVIEPIQAKRVVLNLYGKIKLNVTSMVQGPRGYAPRNIKYERRFFDFPVGEIDLHPYLVDGSTVKRPPSRANSSSSLVGLSSLSRSATSLKNLASSGGHNLVLPEGNYEFPFSTILPGSLTESVEGLPNATVFYKLQATIERGKFLSDISTKRHIRLVRTLTPDSLELFETVAVDNTWPEKVDYSISVPTKAIAIGSSTPISIMIVPLLKGLKLGPVKITLVEFSTYSAPHYNANGAERTIIKVKLRDPLHHMDKDRNTEENAVDSIDFQDKWEVETSIRIPPNLSKCTQDCVILNNIKVRHKLKFVIALVNPDGHVSELRASLPVQLFISPFVTVAVKHQENQESNNTSGHSTENEAEEEEDLIFANANTAIAETDPSEITNGANSAPSTSIFAPPNYANHVYDRLWSDVSVEDTPINSGAQSPTEASHVPLLAEPNDVNELHRSLQRVRLERELHDTDDVGMISDSHVPNRSAVTTPSSLLDVPNQLRGNDYFSIHPSFNGNHSILNVPAHLRSPSQMDSPGFDYLSRANSFDMRPDSPSKSDWEISSLSRVPSYDNAVKTLSVGNDLPPAYPIESFDSTSDTAYSQHSAISLERPRELHLRGAADTNLYSPSKLSISSVGNNDHQSSNSLYNIYNEPHQEGETDDTHAHKHKPSLLRSTSTSALKNHGSKHFGFGLTPLSQISRSSTPPANHTSSSFMLHLPKATSKGPKGSSTTYKSSSLAH